MKTTFAKASAGLAGALVFLGVVIAANVLISQARLRADLTHDKLYTLSAGTRTLVGQLPRDVTLKFYYNRSLEGLPIPVKQYADRVLDLLREYERVSGGKLALEVLDPQPDSDEEEWAQRYGLTAQNLDPMGGTSFYLGLVAVAGAQEAVIPVFNPSQEAQLEYQVTRLVSEVTRATKPKIGVLSSLPVMGMGGMGMFGMPQRGAPAWTLISELRAQYDVVEVNKMAADIPEDLATLLVIHPKDLTDATLFALDQFVLRGGRLVAFVDPLCLADQEAQPQQMGMMMGGNSSDLNKLTSAWGLKYDAGRAVADLRNATRVRTGDGRAERNPSWLSLREDAMAHKELATASLDFLMLPFAGSFSGQAAPGLTLTPLLQPSAGAGTADALTLAMPNPDRAPVINSVTGAQYIALRLTGTFKTAFPDGRPKDVTEPSPNPPPGTAAALKEGTKPGTVVLVGDCDMLYDRFAVERTPFFGREVVQLANDNLSFALNLVEQLSGNEALIGLRSRGSFERPFERVLALEEKAQARWRAEEEKLQAKLTAAQDRISELQNTKDSAQKFVLSAEQQKEIEQFRKDMFETRKELKEVRKNLRSEIESLGGRVKWLNVGLMPALVALFGLAYGMSRRSRAARA